MILSKTVCLLLPQAPAHTCFHVPSLPCIHIHSNIYTLLISYLGSFSKAVLKSVSLGRLFPDFPLTLKRQNSCSVINGKHLQGGLYSYKYLFGSPQL